MAALLGVALLVSCTVADPDVATGAANTSAGIGQSADNTVAASEPDWDGLAECESNQRWHLVNPPYYGGLQEDLTFWRRHGGLDYALRPDLASREAQIAVARIGLAVQGWGAWPACSRRLGLR